MKIKLKYILICVAFMAFSCDDFLKEEPRSFINPGTFFKTEADAEASVIAGYDFYGSGKAATFGFWQDFVFECLHDDFVNRPLGDANGVLDLAYYTGFEPTALGVKNVYSSFFNGINSFCVAIDGIEGMNDFSTKQTLIAEAKFLRAFSYFTLARLYGRVPLIKHSLEANEVREIPRSTTVDEVYDLIISDLEAGITDLWETAPAPGRATKWAAMSLLAKVHLTLGNWEQAAQLAKRVIDESNHALLPVYKDIFSDKNENNVESIYEIQFLLGDEKANQVGNWPRGIGADRKQDYFLGPNWGGLYIATDDFLNSFENGDIRRELISTSVTRSDGLVIKFEADGQPPYYSLKRVPSAYIEGVESNNNSSYNFIFLRLGEVYLMAAEAENELNGPDNAYEYINPIRKRAGLEPLGDLTKEDFRIAVRNERRHELFDERCRYFDLLRWDIIIERTKLVKPTAQIKEHHKKWPIPLAAIDRNPALKGDQNPGYN